MVNQTLNNDDGGGKILHTSTPYVTAINPLRQEIQEKVTCAIPYRLRIVMGDHLYGKTPPPNSMKPLEERGWEGRNPIAKS